MFKIIGADQKEYGPVSAAQIRQWIDDGRLNAASRAQRDTGGDWLPLSEYPEFADLFQVPGAAAPAPGAYAPSPMSAPAGAPLPTASREMASSAIKGPAIALIIISSIGIVLYFLATIGQMLHVNTAQDYSNLPPRLREIMEENHGGRAILTNLLGLLLNAAVLYGAIRMLRLQGHTFAIITCIVAMLPCNCCCFWINIPFAIWALIVLNKPEVKSQFTN